MNRLNQNKNNESTGERKHFIKVDEHTTRIQLATMVCAHLGIPEERMGELKDHLVKQGLGECADGPVTILDIKFMTQILQAFGAEVNVIPYSNEETNS